MTAALNVGNHRVINMSNPVNNTDRVNKAYADSVVGNLALKVDGTNQMLADLNVGNHNVNNVLDPTSAQQGANKNYVDTTRVAIDGSSTMTGDLNMGNKNVNNPTTAPAAPGSFAAQQGATKNYVDGVGTLTSLITS